MRGWEREGSKVLTVSGAMMFRVVLLMGGLGTFFREKGKYGDGYRPVLERGCSWSVFYGVRDVVLDCVHVCQLCLCSRIGAFYWHWRPLFEKIMN